MRKAVITGVAVVAVAGGGVAIASDGADADRVKGAALERVPGRASEVEREGGAWEVEITRPDGAAVEVHLDADLNVVAVEPDR